jgi:geranylgeranyl diphosphate synthase, type II
MISEIQIDETARKLFSEVSFPAEPAGLYDPLRYMIDGGGKRLRPRLCLTAYSLFRDEIGDEVLQPAAGLEVFHTFTLIHDDIMDKSPLRRGNPTVWDKWSEDTAILSGDVMCIDSYRRMAQAPGEVLGKVLNLFNATAAEVCEGQQYDLDFESMEDVTMERYMQMIGLKTAVLLACSAKTGALIGGAADRDADNLYRYGYALGLAFQVADDYLDAFGNEKVFGKPIGGDIINRKKSWLTVRAAEEDSAAMHTAMSMPSGTEEEKADKIRKVTELYRNLNVDRQAEEEIRRLTEEALGYASELNLDAERFGVLKRFADRLVGRKN